MINYEKTNKISMFLIKEEVTAEEMLIVLATVGMSIAISNRIISAEESETDAA